MKSERNHGDDEIQSEGATTSLTSWLISLFTSATNSNTPELGRADPRNKAIMNFENLPLGKILSPAKHSEDDQVELQIAIPVNPSESPSSRRQFTPAEDTLSKKALRALDSVLFLIEQAVEYDRFCQRRAGGSAIRDQALKSFRQNGPIKSFIVVEDLGRPVEIDLNQGIVSIDSLAFSDYFYLVRAVLSAGAQFELHADETYGREASQHSTRAMADSLVSSRLAMIARYTENLESGEIQDKIAWRTALDFHASDVDQTQKLMQIASQLAKIKEACGDSYISDCRSNRIDYDLNKSYQNLYREITLAIHELKLDVAMTYFQFLTDENAEIEYLIGLSEILSKDSEGTPTINLDMLSTLPESSISITSEEGRDKLIKLLSDTHSLWFSNVHFTFKQFIESFENKIAQAIKASEQRHKSLVSYADLFSV